MKDLDTDRALRERRVLAGLGLLAAACAGGATGGPPVVPPELLARAVAEGAVRVIVQLQVAPDAAETAIESAKQAVLAAIAATRHAVVRELPGLPLLALEASPETLQILARSQGVRRVDEDALDRPQR